MQGPGGSAGGALAPRWRREFPAEPASVGEARRGVSEFARAHGAGDEPLSRIGVAISEAASNAVMHAFIGRTPGTLSVIAEAGDGCVLVRVLDDGRGMTPRTDSPGLGMGLTLMASMCTSCEIRAAPGGYGTEVRMAFDALGVTGPALDSTDDARYAVLTEIDRAVEATAWPGEDVARLVDLIVPRLADACALDLREEGGALRRIAARVEGSRGAELSAFLAARQPVPEQVERTIAALRTGEPRVVAIDDDALRALARDDAEATEMAAMELAFWINLPLLSGEHLLGSLGLGLRAARGNADEQMGFLTAVAQRVARGFANTQLISELQRTRRRLEQILSALAEAVTVQDESGRMVYANPAAAALLGAASVDELLRARPGEIAARFVITREDGTPVHPDELPGNRLIAGQRAEPLLTRSADRATGREYWLLTKATRLDDHLVVNIIEDVGEARGAEPRLGGCVHCGSGSS